MKIAIVGILLGIVVAVVLLLMSGGDGAHSARIDDQHKAAAILVARCDAAMSSLDAALGSSQTPSAVIASRLDACTRAKAAVERARQAKSSSQLDVAFERLTKHLARLDALGSNAGSAGSN